MKKRYVSGVMFKILTILLLWNVAFAQKNHDSESPNIIFIMADDLGYGDLSCYGQKLFNTPNIDLLAKKGIRFTQAYAGGPVCTPSRSVLMTGLHNGHTPARDNIPHYQSYLMDEDITVAKVLKEAGYKTGGVGKWSLGDADTEGRATNQGFDFWLGYLNQDHAHFYYTEYLDLNDDTLSLTGNTFTRKFYSHDILTNGALQFIRENKSNPFFLYAAYTIPHFSSLSEDEHGLTVPYIKEEYKHKDWPTDAKKYATMIDLLDQDVGRIVRLIDDLGLEENTIIIFTSDNGGHQGVWEEFDTSGPLKGFKRDLTEGGIRVPFIVKWPGRIPGNMTSNEIIAFQDMMPTLSEIAGGYIPESIDGISVLDAFYGKKLAKPHDFLYWDYGHNRERYDQAIHMGKWKGIRYGIGGDIELFDLSKDIGEENNVAQLYPKVVLEIAEYMKIGYEPNNRYRIGEIYKGSKLWQKN